MPMIYDYCCVPEISYRRNAGGQLDKIYSKSCDFKIKDDGPHVYLILNGEEIALDQHDFIKNAEVLARKSFHELIEKNAIIYKKDKICLNCLKFKEDCLCEDKNIITLNDLNGRKCPKCKEGKIDRINVAIS